VVKETSAVKEITQMAKKKAKTAKGEQMALIEVGPENLEHIVKEVRQYKYHQKQRLLHLKKEVEQKEKIKALIAEAHLQRLEDGNIKFEADHAIICVTPQDDLITIKEKSAEKKPKKSKKSMAGKVKKEELNFEKKSKK
jgi:hypothetical protein